MAPRIGIVSVQGAFIEHERRLCELGADCVQLRNRGDITAGHLDGIVFPGGESTVQSKLLHSLGMFDPLKEIIADGAAVLGTCAGLILLASSVQSNVGAAAAHTTSHAPVQGFGALPVSVARNDYGRQLGSFHAQGVLHVPDYLKKYLPHSCNADAGADPGAQGGLAARVALENENGVHIPLTFIRAPKILETGEGVHALVTYDGYPVGVAYRSIIATAFHPELDEDPAIHQLFVNMAAKVA